MRNDTIRDLRIWLAAALVGLLAQGCGGGDRPGAVVQTRSGAVQGVEREEVQTFLGIPFAAPPLGALRWRPPRPPEPWSGVLAADEAGPVCHQKVFFFERGEEDCLYLNVWTPDPKPEARRPVMLWIHGGGFIVGDGMMGTDGARLAERGDAVVVSMNYRLGALGFLAHPALSGEDPGQPASGRSSGNYSSGNYSSGNYGFLDQIRALEWVRDNIDGFGGDPARVTIFGESAGGLSVCAHLASPLSKGLFHRGIVESGPCHFPFASLEAAEGQGLALSGKLGCGDEADSDLLACMRSRTPGEILEALPPNPAFAFGENEPSWFPVLDGHAFTEQPTARYASGDFNRVPVINGSNGDEGTLIVMLSHEYQLAPLQRSQYIDRLLYLLGTLDKARRVAARYPLDAYERPGAALSEAFGDGFFRCSTRRVTELLGRHVPTWSYVFDYSEARSGLPAVVELGAHHGAEIQYVFQRPNSPFTSEFSGEEQKLADRMLTYWTRFAHSGDPNVKRLPEWPEYGSSGADLVLDLDITTRKGFDDETCAFWNELDYARAPLGEYLQARE
ncbi:MAG: carboxylesterase family protein [Deltaproteobacteria bacterium]|nr:carboxylesterase family protein [Deltaproteobacteria bacterium]MBW2417974.1 carboxylesterase family protein [Deltaproteobacteria bacterium]